METVHQSVEFQSDLAKFEVPEHTLVIDATAQAIQQGVVTIRDKNRELEDYDSIGASPYPLVESDWLYTDSPNYDPILSRVRIGDYSGVLLRPEHTADLQDAKIHNMVEKVARLQEWWKAMWYTETGVDRSFRDLDQPSEAYEMHYRDYRLPVVNFTDTVITESFLSQLERSLAKATELYGLGVWNRLKAITLVKQKELGPSTTAQLNKVQEDSPAACVLRMSAYPMQDEDKYDEYIEEKDAQAIRHKNGSGPLEATFDHEFWHVVTAWTPGDAAWRNNTATRDFLHRKGQSDYGDAIAKTSESDVYPIGIPDDYGQEVRVAQRRQGPLPEELELFDGTKVTKVPLRSKPGTIGLSSVGPVTNYGSVNEAEDGAETAMALGSDVVDPLREVVHADIAKRVRFLNGEALPGGITVQKKDVSSLQKPYISPSVLSIVDPGDWVRIAKKR